MAATQKTTEEKAAAEKARHRKTRVGVVVSDKMTKTVVVEVVRRIRHAMYGKFVRERLRYKAHDESDTVKLGDQVLIEECRPLSRDKRWRVVQTLKKAAGE